MKTIHLARPCSAVDYKDHIQVSKYSICKKLSAIKVIFNTKQITIPLSNILAIQE